VFIFVGIKTQKSKAIAAC